MKKRYLAILLATSMVFASVSSVSAMYEFSDGTSAEISGAGEDVDNSTDDEPELFSDDLTSVDSGDDGLELEMGQSAEIGFSDDFAVEDGGECGSSNISEYLQYSCFRYGLSFRSGEVSGIG